MIEYRDLLELLDHVRPRGGSRGHTARCPAHEDKMNSLAVEQAQGRILAHCYAGCSFGQILTSLGLEAGSLSPDKDRWLNGSPVRKNLELGEPTAIFDYEAADGTVAYKVMRYDTTEGKTFKQFRPDGSGGWTPGLDGVKRVVYHLPELRKATGVVFYVEGEKDVATLEHFGYTATTHCGGANGWKPEYVAFLRGIKNLVVLPDSDEPGSAMAGAICASLPDAEIIELPDLPHKGDVTDWFAAGHTTDELDALVEDVFPRPVYLSAFLEEDDPFEWLVGGMIARGTIGVIVADGTVGKTTLLAQMALCVSSGQNFLGMRVRRGPVLTVLAEGNRAAFKARLKTAMHALGISPTETSWCIQPRRLRSYKIGSTQLERLVASSKATLCILDTLGYFHDGDENSANDWKAKVMGPLRKMSADHNVAFVLVHHASKASEFRKGWQRGRGTSAMFDDADFFLRLETVDGRPELRELTLDKNKYGESGETQVLAIDRSTATFRLSLEGA